jgi:hypothetical protein
VLCWLLLDDQKRLKNSSKKMGMSVRADEPVFRNVVPVFSKGPRKGADQMPRHI